MRIDFYEHLNKDDKVQFSIPDTAKAVKSMNYGQQRFLAALVKLREADENMKYEEYRKHTQQLRQLLESGWY